eukprot:1975052-Pyramimonas_sp.AAC.1
MRWGCRGEVGRPGGASRMILGEKSWGRGPLKKRLHGVEMSERAGKARWGVSDDFGREIAWSGPPKTEAP